MNGVERKLWLDRRLLVATGLLLLLAILFRRPLMGVLQLAGKENLFSHLPLIPAVCLYLLFIARRRCPPKFETDVLPAALFFLLGAACLAVWWPMRQAAELPLNDLLAWPILSLVCLVLAIVAACFGWQTVKTYRFELAFLLFFVPMPHSLFHPIEVFLQHSSADAFDVLLGFTGNPVYRDGVVFQLSGLTLEVAIECSGIRSTLVLFITSLLAGHLFLPHRWQRLVLVLAAVPLGILRNGFRIFSIALLTIHVDEGVIKGPLHTRGGPLFFVLSLVVLFALLFALRWVGRERVERSADTPNPAHDPAPDQGTTS